MAPSANALVITEEPGAQLVPSRATFSRLPASEMSRSLAPIFLASAFCKKYHRDVRMFGGDTEMKLRKRALAEGCLGKKHKSKKKPAAKAKAKKKTKSNNSFFNSTSEPSPIKRTGTTVTFKNEKQLCEWARFQFCYRTPGQCDFTAKLRKQVRQQAKNCRSKGYW